MVLLSYKLALRFAFCVIVPTTIYIVWLTEKNVLQNLFPEFKLFFHIKTWKLLNHYLR